RLHENGLGFRIGLLVAGILMMAIGTAFYIGGGLGARPRDSLMLGVKQRVPFRIGAVRTGIAASALVAGFALGGTVGIGTLAFVLGIGPAVGASFALPRRSPLSSDWTAPAATRSIAFPIAATARSMSCAVITSGGLIFSTLSCGPSV